MKFKVLIGAAFCVMAATAVTSAPAFAGPTYEFDVSTGVQPSDVGQITLTQGTLSDPTDLDSVTIDLLFKSGIYGVLNNQIPFAFELDPTNSALLAETLGITFIKPAGGTYVDSKGDTDTLGLATARGSQKLFKQPGFGSFNTELTDTAGNGSPHAYYSELTFTLSCTAHCGTTGLDTNDFVQNGSNVYFTVDITNGSSTGPQAWESRKRVPEPATITLFGGVLTGMGWLRRRRTNRAATGSV